MRFDYQAINAEGLRVEGLVEEEDLRAATRKVERQGLVVIDVRPYQAESRTGRTWRRGPGAMERLAALQQLVTLLKSGVPLDESLSSLADSADHPAIAESLARVSEGVRRGEAFSEALSAADLQLPRYVLQLARAGEFTGELAGNLEKAAEQMAYEQRIAAEMRTALLYPSILVVSGIAAVLLIFVLVVPKFTGMLDKGGADVPWLAAAVLGTGKFVNDNLLLLGFAGGGLALAAGMLLARPKVRLLLYDRLFGLPMAGEWLFQTEIARWSGLLGTLVGSKVELTSALELALQAVKASRLRGALSQVTRAVREGSALADALQDNGAITRMGYGLIRVGERSGELPAMLNSLSNMYAENGRNRMKRFLAILEPAAILTIGAVIGVIMTGIILAITSVNEVSF